MGIKSVLALAFVLVVVTAANISSDGSAQFSKNDSIAKSSPSHHLIVGGRVPGDQLVYQRSIVKSSSWMQVTTWQQTFNSTRYAVITQVQALDQKTNGNGAQASLIAGGPGHTYVTLKFKSKRGHGIHFIVNLYAR